jgi:hypothetical protein
MTTTEQSYKAEAEYWKDQYMKLLAKVCDVRELQVKRSKLKSYFPVQDKTKLYNGEKALDKKVEQLKEDLKLLNQQKLFSVNG